MKKNLLFIAIALAIGGYQAQAQISTIQSDIAESSQKLISVMQPSMLTQGPQKVSHGVITPEGTPVQYTLTMNIQASYPLNKLVDVIFSEDGSNVFINNLFPGVIPLEWGAWIKGDVQEDNTIKIEPQKFLVYDASGDESLTYDFWVARTTTLTDLYDFYLKINEDGTITQLNATDFLGLFAYQGETFVGPQNYGNGILLRKGDFEPKPLELPETAEIKDFIYKYNDKYNATKVYVGQVAFDGDDVYFSDVVPETKCWVKGTISDDIVTFTPGQYVGTTGSYELYLSFLSFTHDFKNATPVDEYKLIYDPESGVFTSYETEELMFAIVSGLSNGKVYSYNFTFIITPYDGPKPGIPADPYNLSIIPNTASEGMSYLSFKKTNINAEGQYFEPENLYIRAYLDDEPYTFAVGEYSTITEDTELVHWQLNDRIDFWSTDDQEYLNFHEALFETLGAQIVYIYEGKEYPSNIVLVNLEGEEEVIHVDPPSGIDTIESEYTSDQYFNLLGIPVDSNTKGFLIHKGSKIFNR